MSAGATAGSGATTAAAVDVEEAEGGAGADRTTGAGRAVTEGDAGAADGAVPSVPPVAAAISGRTQSMTNRYGPYSA